MTSDDDNSGKNKNPWGQSAGGKDQPKNPWGAPGKGQPGNGNGSNGGGGSGRRPKNDFDDVFANLQNTLRRIMPGNLGGGELIAAGIAILALLWLASGFYIVNPGEHAVVQRFGAWNRTVATEGLKYHLPSPLETATKFNVNEIRTMTIGFTGSNSKSQRGTAQGGRDVPEESLMLTSDFNIVDLDFVVQWNISSAEDYLFNIQDPENTLNKVAQSAVREIVGQTRMFPIITTERGTVAEEAKAIMQQILNEYKSGINITQVLINSAEVHPDVQNAFQDVQSAKQDAEDVQNRAEAYRQDIIPRARGAATRVLQEAQAYKQAELSRATGDASRFNAILAAYQNGQEVTKERIYIETMESILKNAQKIILDGNGKGAVPYLPLDSLTKLPPAPAQTAQPNALPGSALGNPSKPQGQ